MELERGGRLTDTGGATGHTHELSDLDDIDTAGAADGHIMMFTGDAWVAENPVGTVVDATIPTPPAIASTVSGAYLDSVGNPTASVTVTLTPPTLNVDKSTESLPVLPKPIGSVIASPQHSRMDLSSGSLVERIMFM